MNILIYGHKSDKFNLLSAHHKLNFTLDIDPDLTGYDGFINFRLKHQLDVLINVFNRWSNENKIIINIGSRSKYPNLSKGFSYAAQNAALSHMSNSIRFLSDKQCRVVDINPGLIDSKLPCISWDDVSNALIWILSLPDNIEIGELSIWDKTPYHLISKMKDEEK